MKWYDLTITEDNFKYIYSTGNFVLATKSSYTSSIIYLDMKNVAAANSDKKTIREVGIR